MLTFLVHSEQILEQIDKWTSNLSSVDKFISFVVDMSALMACRLSSTTRRCCAALSPKSLKSDGQASRKIVYFKYGYKISNCQQINSEQLVASRFLSGYMPSTEDDHLKCWNCQEDFSHCVHSMVIHRRHSKNRLTLVAFLIEFDHKLGN